MLRAKASHLENCVACQIPGFSRYKWACRFFHLLQMNSDWASISESQMCGSPTTASVAAYPRVPAWLLAVLLALVTVALYWPATGYDYINYDDNLYVGAMFMSKAGCGWKMWGLVGVLKYGVADNWHPLTVLSHMLVCQGIVEWRQRGRRFPSGQRCCLHAPQRGARLLLAAPGDGLRRPGGVCWWRRYSRSIRCDFSRSSGFRNGRMCSVFSLACSRSFATRATKRGN